MKHTRRDALQCVSTTAPKKNPNKFGPQSKILASAIRGFKSAVKKYATLNNIEFEWQPRYYDHIIRDEPDFYRIQIYISDNMNNRESQINGRETQMKDA